VVQLQGTLRQYKEETADYLTTAAVISFPSEGPLPQGLVKKLVRASLRDMKSLVR
jgi:uncharacterized protein YdhG (YjbR/CyaY superfamily)